MSEKIALLFFAALYCTLNIALFDRSAFIVQLLSFCKGELHFYMPPFQIQFQRDEREPFFLCLTDQLPDLLCVQQQTPVARRVMIRIRALLIRTDMRSEKPHFAVTNHRVTIL